jgi:asparaginyl-tRNA synthetase
VSVVGKKTALPKGVYSSQDFEITDAKVEVLSKGDPAAISMCPPDAASDVRLERRLYYFRDAEFTEVLRLSDLLCQSFRKYFQETKCVEVLPPSFTGVECEGGATLFKLDHPGKTSDKSMPAYLTQSSQFALEYLVPGLGDCYCIAPSYRAENSHTRRHLTEFTHVEAEWGGIRKFEDHIAKLKTMLTRVLEIFLELGRKSLETLGKYDRVKELLIKVENAIVLTHYEAIKKCRELGIDGPDGAPFGDRDDIPEMQERKLIDTLDKVVFLVKFPKEFKSFYMGLDPVDDSYVLGCDVEVPGVGEIIGSGVREADYERLIERLTECKLKSTDYLDYLELRKSGYCQTSGMGLGLGRMLCWLLDKQSIRDVVAFPRFPGYLMP